MSKAVTEGSLRNIQGIGVPLLLVIGMVFIVWQLNDRYRSDQEDLRTEWKQEVGRLDGQLGKIGSQLQTIANALDVITRRVDRDAAEVQNRTMDRYTRADRYIECLRERDGDDELKCDKIIYSPPFTVNRTWMAFYEQSR